LSREVCFLIRKAGRVEDGEGKVGQSLGRSRQKLP